MMGITPAEVTDVISKTYYWQIKKFNPNAAKDEFTILLLCIIRLFYMEKKQSELELSSIYLSFSGKFYPSIHYGSYQKVEPSQYRHIMEYVVNTQLSNKYDIKKYGSVFGAIKSIVNTWLSSYPDRFRDFEDEDIVYLIQQLHTRIKSFTKNIAEVYYAAYENKDSYMTYDSDNMSEEKYRLADNDSLKIERYVESTMTLINSSGVDYKLCSIAANNNIKTDELKSIVETIISDNINVGQIKELTRLLLSEYFLVAKDKNPANIDFISTSIAVKPNSKNENVNRIKEIVEGWLDENSLAYRKKKSRLATKSAYNKALLSYFVLVIHSAAKGA